MLVAAVAVAVRLTEYLTRQSYSVDSYMTENNLRSASRPAHRSVFLSSDWLRFPDMPIGKPGLPLAVPRQLPASHQDSQEWGLSSYGFARQLMKAFHIVSQADQVPFPTDFLHPSEKELPEA